MATIDLKLKTYDELQFEVITLNTNKYLLEQENKQLKVKSEVLEENNKLLIQQKAQMYEDLDIAYEKIDKAIEYIKNDYDEENYYFVPKKKLLEILGDKENERF